jgi:hypothetical protein
MQRIFLDQQLHGLGGSVAGAVHVDAGQELFSPHGKRAAEPGDLRHGT